MRLLLLFAGCLSLSGCASSERMARLSGGVVQEYSTPRAHRVRSANFQKKTAAYAGEKRQERNGFSEKSLINIWPFFFRSDDYYSALWPFFDMDPYGFALRPFFNKEGNDFSVLFPLSSWNFVDQDGWITSFYWNRNSIGFFPLFHHFAAKQREFFYYTPLCIRSREHYASPSWHHPLKEKNFLFLLLGYYQKKRLTDTRNHQHLFPIWGKDKYPQYLRELLAYKLTGTSTPIPRTPRELDAYRKKVFSSLPEREEKHYGFVPLYFAWDKNNSSGFNILMMLLYYDRSPHYSRVWSLFHFLYSSSFFKGEPLDRLDTRAKWIIPPLLFYAGYNDFKKETPQRKDLLRFRHLTRQNQEPFGKNLPEMKKLYKKLSGKEMPAVICSYPLAELWVKEFAARQTWLKKRENYGGFLPLFCFYSSPEKFFWTIPALLTFSEKRLHSCILHSYFLSLPLFTLWKNSPDEVLRTTAGPLGYYHKTRRNKQIQAPVFDRNTYWVKSWQQHRFEDTYALCGLYYHGRDGFSIAKKGLDAKMIESIRKRSFELKNLSAQLQREEKALSQRKTRNNNWKVKSRLDELKKMVDTEEIRLTEEKFRKKQQDFEKRLKKWSQDAARFGVRFDRASLEPKNFEPQLREFLAKSTDLRFSEDFGSGFFFRKELAENGDFNWHILAYLASGSKKGDQEKTQILHFFYRRTKEAHREEKIIFPFITVRQDKNTRSTSFLWRLWESHTSPSGKGGHILFIPWGTPAQ